MVKYAHGILIMERCFFITGATGMVGKEVVDWLLKNTNARVVILEYGNTFDLSSDKQDRITKVKGDITIPNLNLSDFDLEQIDQVTDVIHAAGTTNFGTDIDTARKLNVEGTKNTFRLFKDRVVRFGYVSTAYVAGKREGAILESELEHEKAFANAYEQSKYEAESWLKSKDVPVNIYRLTTLLGNSQDGSTNVFTAPHQLMRFCYLGLVSMIPGEPDNKIDLLPTDYAVATMCELHVDSDCNETICFHICSGISSPTLQELIDVTFTTFEQYDKKWAGLNISRPLLVSNDTFKEFIGAVEETQNKVFLQVINNTKFFSDQLVFEKVFDSKNVTRVISDYQQKIPKVANVYKKVLLFCLQTNWGKKEI